MRTHREWSQNNSCSTEVKFCNFKTIIKFPLSPPPLPLSLMLISCKFEKQENEFEFNATVPKMNLPRISWHKLLKRNYRVKTIICTIPEPEPETRTFWSNPTRTRPEVKKPYSSKPGCMARKSYFLLQANI